ncbi:unnamed protein product [Symbiodinium microadriaticum]|nr:unnamed protein product [Symbiodinium microadriaticum]
MEFMYMNRIRWNVLTFNTTISIQTNDKWEEKRDEKNLGPEEGWGEVTLRWEGSDVTLLSHSSTSKSVTLPGTFAATIDMIAETAGDFLITVDGYEQYGAMAQFSVIDDGTYVPKSPKKSNKDEEFSSDAVAAISVIMCSVAVVIFVILYIARQKRSNQYTKTLDDSSTIVFNPVLGMNSSHSSGGSVQCSWCSGPHSAQDCKALREYTHNSKKGSVPGDAPTSSHSKLSDTELMPLDNI